jgi:hypothetical protein
MFYTEVDGLQKELGYYTSKGGRERILEVRRVL